MSRGYGQELLGTKLRTQFSIFGRNLGVFILLYVLTGGIIFYLLIEEEFYRNLGEFLKLYLPGNEGNRKKYSILYESYFSSSENVNNTLLYSNLGGLFMSVLGSFSFYKLYNRMNKKMKEDKYLGGARLVSAVELKEEMERNRKGSTHDSLVVTKEKIHFPFKMLFRHMGMLGQTGRGKSVFIKEYITQLRERGTKLFIIDINGDYYQNFGKPGDKILSLGDKRSQNWDFWAEDILPDTMASYLIPPGKDPNDFWVNSSRIVLRALLEAAVNYPRNERVQVIFNALTNGVEELIEFLETNDKVAASKTLGDAASNQAAGIVGTLAATVTPILESMLQAQAFNKNANSQPVSLMDWVEDTDDSSWTFVVMRDDDIERTKSIMQCWANCVIQGCLRRNPETVGEQIPLVILIDEIASIGFIQELTKGFERLRKHMGSLVLGYQNNAQLNLIFGKERADIIKDNMLTKAIYSSIDPNSQKELSQVLGEQEVRKFVESEEIVLSEKQGISRQYRDIKEPIVSPTDIGKLADLELYLKIGEYNAVKTSLQHVLYPSLNTRMEYPSREEIEERNSVTKTQESYTVEENNSQEIPQEIEEIPQEQVKKEKEVTTKTSSINKPVENEEEELEEELMEDEEQEIF